MPTKKKRVGFIPREDVMRIIDKLSIENNLSNSKIISILVEEALSTRGIFNMKNGKANEIFDLNDYNSQKSFDNSDKFVDDAELTINTKLINHYKLSDTPFFKEPNQESFDLQTYKKFLSFLKFKEMMDKHNT